MLLQDYLVCLIENKEVRNSREVIKFLELHVFCPEFLINTPSLLFQEREKTGYVINLIKFIPQHNLFVTCSNNKKQNRSHIKIFNFKASNMVEDSFMIKRQKMQKH